jgi:hypothetical protein
LERLIGIEEVEFDTSIAAFDISITTIQKCK